jgi:hypothetical protein
MAKTRTKRQFTPSQNSEISRVLNLLETFTKSEITKIKRAYPYTIIKTNFGYALCFYKIYEIDNQYVVKTNTEDVLGEFSTLLHAILFSLLMNKNQFDLANKLSVSSGDYLSSNNEVKFYEKKLSDFRKKKTKDWWQYDLYVGKLSQAKNRVEISKTQLSNSVSDAKYIIKYIKGLNL